MLTRYWLLGLLMGLAFSPVGYQLGKIAGLREARRVHKNLTRGDFR